MSQIIAIAERRREPRFGAWHRPVHFSRPLNPEGLGATASSVSRPDLLDQAVKVAAAAGINLTCKEEAGWFPDMTGGQQYYLNRVCSAPGTGFNFSADAIASGMMTDVLKEDIARSKTYEPIQIVQIDPALNFQLPAGYKDPVTTAITSTPTKVSQPSTTAPDARSNTYKPTIYDAPPKSITTPQPAGTAQPPAGPARSKEVIQEQAGGKSPVESAIGQGQQFIADSGIPAWVWIAAAIGIAFFAGRGQK